MSGPSITTWSRLEPRPRTDSIARPLAAQVRDPVWFLTRQWQFGEFQGEDAASPAWVEIKARFSKVDAWGPPNEPAKPLEAAAESEPFTPDDATAVELGQRFEFLLARAHAASAITLSMTLAALVQKFRASYPLSTGSIDPTDRQTQQFRRVLRNRGMDGWLLYDNTQHTTSPSAPAIADAAVNAVISTTVELWRAWVKAAFGTVGRADTSTWRHERLEYAVQVTATTPTGARAAFDAHPGRHGAFDWYAFDERAVNPHEEIPTQPSPITEFERTVLPTSVQFRGMPHARWWQMQDRIADLGEIHPEIRELAKVVLMDFMFVHGSNWFVVPFTQDVGTLCRIDRLIVHDVFGGRTQIERADRLMPDADKAARRWSMFATSTATDTAGGLADYFILPPSADSATLSGETIESVRFIRDEMANMAWAIEHTTENGIGMPWLGRDRTRGDRQEITTPPATAGAALRYRLQNSVPGHWIPFVPVPINGGAEGQVALERAAMLRPTEDEPGGAYQSILPVGRILKPTVRVREEEVSRAGVTVSRVVRRTRWIDGSTHLWIARRKQAGRGEGSSGLRFDVVEKTAGSSS